MMDRRTAIATGAAMIASAAAAKAPRNAQPSRDFVTVDAGRFRLGGRAYRFAGANMWYAVYLGAEGPTGDRDRLRRELDALSALGVTNLRILGESELSPLKNSIRPT